MSDKPPRMTPDPGKPKPKPSKKLTPMEIMHQYGEPMSISKLAKETAADPARFFPKPSEELAPEYRASIARVVQRGGMRHERKGQYFDESASPELRRLFPVYELQKIKAAFPKMLEISFDEQPAENEEGRLFTLELRMVSIDGNDDFSIPCGPFPPASTESLIRIIREFQNQAAKQVLEDLEATRAMFESFDDD